MIKGSLNHDSLDLRIYLIINQENPLILKITVQTFFLLKNYDCS